MESTYTTNVVYVQSIKSSPSLVIQLNYTLEDKNRLFTFERLKTEPLFKCLQRIENNINKSGRRICSKTAKQKSDSKTISVVHNLKLVNSKGDEIDAAQSNKAAWTEDNILFINEDAFCVKYNVPKIMECILPDVIMVNFPVYLRMWLVFCLDEDISIEWFVSKCDSTESEWCHIKSGLDFTPNVSQLDCRLLVRITVKTNRWSPMVSVQSQNRVRMGPEQYRLNWLCDRLKHVSSTLGNKSQMKNHFTLVTYNILKDRHIHDDSYCNIQYRIQLVLRELLILRSSIICLQVS